MKNAERTNEILHPRCIRAADYVRDLMITHPPTDGRAHRQSQWHAVQQYRSALYYSPANPLIQIPHRADEPATRDEEGGIRSSIPIRTPLYLHSVVLASPWSDSRASSCSRTRWLLAFYKGVSGWHFAANSTIVDQEAILPKKKGLYFAAREGLWGSRKFSVLMFIRREIL